MPFFPQLSTGSSAHYPLLKVRRTRTVENHAPDGSRWRLGDPDAASVRWEMRYSGLSDEEWLTLKSFFELCEGRLQTFTFLDPTDNLLSASEDLEAEEWSNSPLIQLAAGVTDPDGASRATRLTNAAQVDQSVQQVLSVSAQQHYCFSFYGRATAATFAALRQTAGAATVERTVSLSEQWTRYSCSGKLGVDQETVAFALDLAAGAVVDVFGLQVEAQPGASAYKRTAASAGIYPQARFADDTITLTSEGIGSHSTILRIESALTE